jgi:hypothetical protein
MTIDFYSFSNSRGVVDVGTVERQLARLDDQAAKIIQRLVKGKKLLERERMHLARFVSVMWRRTPKHREKVNKVAKDMVPSILEEFVRQREPLSDAERAEVERLREYYNSQDLDFVFAHNVLRGSMFERLMNDMDWAFFRPPTDIEFLTCDDPVLFSTGSGLGHKDATIIFPLSRRLLLQCKWNSGWGNEFHELTRDQMDYFNLWTVKGAHKQVYASFRSEQLRRLVNNNIATMS